MLLRTFIGRGQNINTNRSLEKVDSNSHGWFWGVQDFSGVSRSVSNSTTADVVEIARELEVELEDVSELLQSRDKSLIDEEVLLMEEQRELFLEMESTPGEDCWKDKKKWFRILYKISWKAEAGLERIGSNFERSCTVDKMLSNSITCYREIISWCSKLRCLILRKCHSHLSLQPPLPRSVKSYQYQGKTLHQQKDYDLLKAQMMVSIVQQQSIFKLRYVHYCFRHHAIAHLIDYSIV